MIMNKPIRIGIIGCGFIGQVAHLPHYISNNDCEVVALAELREELGKKLCKRWDIPKFYNNHHDLLDDPDVDAVVIVVRRHHTATIALDAIKAKKHLLTEKPMAQTLEQAKLLAEEAKKNNLIYSVGFMRRYDPTVNWVKNKLFNVLNSGQLGKILSFRCFLSAGGDYCNIGGEIKTQEPRPTHQILPIAPSFLPDNLHRQFEHFVNVCGHDINLIRYLFSDLQIKPKYFEHKIGRGAIVILDMGEFSGTLEWSDTLQPKKWDEGIEIRFEKGYLKLDLVPAFLRNCPSNACLYVDNGEEGYFESPRSDWTWAFQNEDNEFIKCLGNHKSTRSVAEDCVKDMELIEQIWRLRI